MNSRMTLKAALKLNEDLKKDLAAANRKADFLRLCYIKSEAARVLRGSILSPEEVKLDAAKKVDAELRFEAVMDLFKNNLPSMNGKVVVQMLDPVDGWKEVERIYLEEYFFQAAADVDYRKTSPRHIKSRLIHEINDHVNVVLYA